MAYVNFNRTKPASFALSEYADRNTIYFTTDTHEIIINGEAFGTDDLSELQKQIEALAEEADGIAADLNELTALVNQNSEDITSLEEVIVENELTTQNALNTLTTLVNQNSENITSLESIIVENELTTSAALNDLNDRLLDIISEEYINGLFV